MIIVNLKDIYPSDSQHQLSDKLKYNFNQLLRLGVGEQGIQGPIGPTGGQGIPGMQGPIGTRGNYWYSGTIDPVSIPGEIENDCYINSALQHESIWQKNTTGGTLGWHKTIDLRDIINSAINVTSPFHRTPSGTPAFWYKFITPLAAAVNDWSSVLFMAAENQNLLSAGAAGDHNAQLMGKSQSVFLGSNDFTHANAIPYSIVIGEVDYVYAPGTGIPDGLNPVVSINDTLRISSKYNHTSTTVKPTDARSVFNMSSSDDMISGASSVSTSMSFSTRYNIPSTALVNTQQFVLGTNGTFAVYQDAVASTASQIFGTGNLEFSGGLFTSRVGLSNYQAIAIGTGYQANATRAFILTSDLITGLYVNKSLIPLRKDVGVDVLNLGSNLDSGNGHWDYAYLKSGIGFTANASTQAFKFWRNTGNFAPGTTDTDCTVAITSKGSLVIGKNIANYNGAGNPHGITAIGLSAAPGDGGGNSQGNSSNRANIHIFEEVQGLTGIGSNLNEGAIIISKKFKYKDSGNKSGIIIGQELNVTANIGVGTGTTISGLDIGVAQTSTFSGAVANIRGIDMYLYSSNNAQNISNMSGVNVGADLIGTTSTTRITGSYKGLNVNVLSKYSGTERVLGLSPNGMAAKYGLYQYGATDAINYMSGHVQFGGLGSGYKIANGMPDGHVIDVLSGGTTESGNLSIYAASSTNSQKASDLYFKAGTAIVGIDEWSGAGLSLSGGKPVPDQYSGYAILSSGETATNGIAHGASMLALYSATNSLPGYALLSGGNSAGIDSTGGTVTIQGGAGSTPIGGSSAAGASVITRGGGGGMTATGGDLYLSGGNGYVGGNVSVTTGVGDTNSGNLILNTGTALSGVSGNISIATGTSQLDAGDILINTGNSNLESGGNLYITLGNGGTGGGGLSIETGTGNPANINSVGGNLNIQTGNGSRRGGDISLNGGQATNTSGTSAGGSISLSGGGGSGATGGAGGILWVEAGMGFLPGETTILGGTAISYNGLDNIKGGNVYIAGGKPTGISLHAPYGGGNVMIGTVKISGDTFIGKVGIRKDITISTPSQVDVDISGDVRIDGDILWGTSNTAGWTDIFTQTDIVSMTPTGLVSRITGTNSTLKCKRIGSIAFFTFDIEITNTVNASTVSGTFPSSIPGIGRINNNANMYGTVWVKSSSDVYTSYQCKMYYDNNTNNVISFPLFGSNEILTGQMFCEMY